LLLVAVTLFCLTVWQAPMSIKRLESGTPRTLEIEHDDENDDEAGLPQGNRNCRIAAFIIIFVGILIVGIVMYLKPKVGARKGGYMLGAVLLILGGVVAIIAFGLDVGNLNDATYCRDRDQGTVIIDIDPRVRCQTYRNIAVATCASAGVAGFLAIYTGIVVIVAALKAGKEIKEDDFDATYHPRPISRSSRTAKTVVLVLLAATFAATVILTVFTILLHEARETKYLDEVVGTRFTTNDRSGWPEKNTRLRLALTILVIGALVFNLIPFRSRVVAYVIAFILLVCTVLCIFAFALDVKAVDTAKDMPCPIGWDCEYHRYIAVCVFDILLALLLMVYILVEFVVRVAMDDTHVRALPYAY